MVSFMSKSLQIKLHQFRAACILIALGCVQPLFAQQTKESESKIGFANETTQKWEMGIEVYAAGTVNGISAIFPIPIDWPEQKVKLISENKSKQVSRITTKFVGTDRSCKIAIVTIPRLKTGESARATLTFEIKKSHITEPKTKTEFQFSTTAKRKLRNYLIPSPFIESTHPRIKAIAKSSIESNLDSWKEVESIFNWVRTNIDYEFDEQIKSCITALENYKGDCEELSSIFIAICRAKGIPARAVWIPGHTYPEFYLEDKEGNGHWIPCQVAGGNNDFGRMPEDKPILQKGDRFKIPGHKSVQRYARPTLSAKNATANPTLKWITEKIE